MMNNFQFPTTVIPSSVGMFTRGHLGTGVFTGCSANVAKRGYAAWGTVPWSPSSC